MKYAHLVCVVKDAAVPGMVRGDWRDLWALYERAGDRPGSFSFSKSLPAHAGVSVARTGPSGGHGLDAVVREAIASYAHDTLRSDRVGSKLVCLGGLVGPKQMELLVAVDTSCQDEETRQQFGRIKSRTSSLVLQSGALFSSEQRLWGTGNWWAESTDSELMQTLWSIRRRDEIARGAVTIAGNQSFDRRT